MRQRSQESKRVVKCMKDMFSILRNGYAQPLIVVSGYWFMVQQRIRCGSLSFLFRALNISEQFHTSATSLKVNPNDESFSC